VIRASRRPGRSAGRRALAARPARAWSAARAARLSGRLEDVQKVCTHRPAAGCLRRGRSSTLVVGDVSGRGWDASPCLSGRTKIVTSVVGMSAGVDWARELAATRMADPLPRRWGHVQAVAAKAEWLRPVLGEDADLLVAAAWLHDVGYAPDVANTGFHPLDGARYLRSLGLDVRLCGLVANHSAARYEAELRGLVVELAEFPDEDSLARHGLWYCDMTTSPVGDAVTFDERLAEIRQRYGANHAVPRALTAASDEIRTAIDTTLSRASALGKPSP
jgi:putative nucleotidyltransferase with HDIG domain